MALEVESARAVCSKCGTDYSRQKGYFPVSYAALHKGVGHTHVCRDCIDSLYNGYLAQCNNSKDAVRQVCRKLDLYWNEKVFCQVEKKNTTRSMMTQYMSRVTSITYAGKSYDDTLSEEGTLWSFRQEFKQDTPDESEEIPDKLSDESETNVVEDAIEVPEEVIAFWGPGYSSEMYEALEQRRSYWMSKLPDTDIDIGTEAIIRQICSLELDINRDRAAGRAVDKSITALNTLLGSASLKPAQKKDNADSSINNTPFGVWIQRWENQRPIPEPDPELEDVDGIVRYISIWFFGHLCKMLGIKNSYCKLYEDEIAKMRIERPEYDGEDDETMFNDIFGANEETEETGHVKDSNENEAIEDV